MKNMGREKGYCFLLFQRGKLLWARLPQIVHWMEYFTRTRNHRNTEDGGGWRHGRRLTHVPFVYLCWGAFISSDSFFLDHLILMDGNRIFGQNGSWGYFGLRGNLWTEYWVYLTPKTRKLGPVMKINYLELCEIGYPEICKNWRPKIPPQVSAI